MKLDELVAILLQEVKSVPEIKEEHLVRFAELRDQIDADPHSELVHTFFTLLRKQWNSRIQTTARNASILGVNGCELEDMLSLADDALWKVLMDYGRRKSAGGIAKFNTFFYHHYSNQVRTLYSLNGVINQSTFRILVYNPKEKIHLDWNTATRKAYLGKRSIQGFIVSSWMKQEHQIQEFLASLDISNLDYAIIRRERNRRKMLSQQTISLHSVLQNVDQDPDDNSTLEACLGVEDTLPSLLELRDILKRRIQDRRLRKLALLLYQGYNPKDMRDREAMLFQYNTSNEQVLCDHMKCTKPEIVSLIRQLQRYCKKRVLSEVRN